MNYYELQIETAGPGVELVENELTELGIAQFVVDDPNLDIQMMDEAWGTEYVDREEILARKDRSATVTVYTETLEEAEAIRRKLLDWMPAVRNRLASGVYGENLNADSLGSGKIRLTLRGDAGMEGQVEGLLQAHKDYGTHRGLPELGGIRTGIGRGSGDFHRSGYGLRNGNS